MAKKNSSTIRPLEPEASAADAALSTVTRLRSGYKTTRIMLTFEQVSGETVVTVFNWRSPLQLEERSIELAAQLKEQGQQTPLTLRPLGLAPGEDFDAENVGSLGIIRGHSRMAGFRLLARQEGKKGFDKLFPEGVAADVIEGLSEQEAALLANDNASSVNMETVYDWHMAGNGLLRARVTRGDMMLSIENVTERLFPIKAGTDNGDAIVKVREKIAALDAEVATLSQKVDSLDPKQPGVDAVRDSLVTMRDMRVKERDGLKKEESKLIEDIRRGLADRLQNNWNAGVYADYWLHQTVLKKAHPDCPENLVPIFAAVAYNVKGDIPALAKAAKEDAQTKAPALTEQQRERVTQGANWRAAFDKLVTRAKKKIAETEDEDDAPRAKSKTGKEMAAIGDARESVGLRKVFDVLTGKTKLSGEEETKTFQMVDGLLTIAELVSQHDPDFWREEVVTRYRDLRKKLAKEAASALTEDPETGGDVDKETGEPVEEPKAPKAAPKAKRSRGRKPR